MKVFVCGGAGYIGSHLVLALKSCGWSPIIVDSLVATNGYRAHVDALQVPLERGDVRDTAFLDRIFAEHKPDAVVHMCASLVVPESVADPLSYYDNNVVGTMRILQAMVRHGCTQFLFSSTAAIFGTTSKALVEPDDPTLPESPYGRTKLICEQMIVDCCAAYNVRAVRLRYFNACGADPSGALGWARGATHLIPLVLQVALGKRAKLNIYGDDYATPDGTGVRDFVHVGDLASAHIAALRYLAAGGASDYFNLGSGTGYSVKEVVEAARRVTGHAIPVEVAPRRPGDLPAVVASPEKAERVLGWTRQYARIEDIVATSWNFLRLHPDGIGSSPADAGQGAAGSA